MVDEIQNTSIFLQHKATTNNSFIVLSSLQLRLIMKTL